jgi:hypothetical protein
MNKCRICNGDATLYPPLGDVDHLASAGCGEYKITGTEVGIASARQVSVAVMRERLNKHRKRSTKVPLIGGLGVGDIQMAYE